MVSRAAARGPRRTCAPARARVCRYCASVYSALVLFAAAASGPAGWFPRDQLMPALVGGWVAVAAVAGGCYARWRALHPLPAAALHGVVGGVATEPGVVALPPAAARVPPLYDPSLSWGDMNTLPAGVEA